MERKPPNKIDKTDDRLFERTGHFSELERRAVLVSVQHEYMGLDCADQSLEAVLRLELESYVQERRCVCHGHVNSPLPIRP